MTDIDTEREAKLPRWAQWELRALREQVYLLEGLVNGVDKGGPVYLDVFNRPRLGLGDADITFDLSVGPITASVPHTGKYIDLRAYHGALVAQPQSSNVLRVTGGDWW